MATGFGAGASFFQAFYVSDPTNTDFLEFYSPHLLMTHNVFFLIAQFGVSYAIWHVILEAETLLKRHMFFARLRNVIVIVSFVIAYICTLSSGHIESILHLKYVEDPTWFIDTYTSGGNVTVGLTDEIQQELFTWQSACQIRCGALFVVWGLLSAQLFRHISQATTYSGDNKDTVTSF